MQTPNWICADGRPVPLGLMTTRHIRNAYEYLQRGTGVLGVMARPGCSGFSNREWLLLFLR